VITGSSLPQVVALDVLAPTQAAKVERPVRTWVNLGVASVLVLVTKKGLEFALHRLAPSLEDNARRSDAFHGQLNVKPIFDKDA
jgi:hypothetical protein